MEKSLTEAVADIVLSWTDELIQDMRTDLDRQVKSKRNNLAQSISPSLIVTRNGVSMELSLADYYDFVDKGVNGMQGNQGSIYSYKTARPSKKHAQAIAEWITDAGIDFKGRGSDNWAKARLNAGYAMATSIKKKGLKPKPFFDKNINQARVEDLSQRILDATGIVVELQLLG